MKAIIDRIRRLLDNVYVFLGMADILNEGSCHAGRSLCRIPALIPRYEETAIRIMRSVAENRICLRSVLKYVRTVQVRYLWLLLIGLGLNR